MVPIQVPPQLTANFDLIDQFVSDAAATQPVAQPNVALVTGPTGGDSVMDDFDFDLLLYGSEEPGAFLG